MSGSSRYARGLSDEFGEIERRLRSLERTLESVGARASGSARQTAGSVGDTLASALSGWADRFRQSTGTLGDRSAAFGKNAAAGGSRALSRVSDETGQRPLVALAVAIGVGIMIGMASRSWKS
jgi:ElaB/YqjD/DUF883 family membrane-anchored ribosome-binding protein